MTSRAAKICCSCSTITPARLRPLSSAQTREAMYSTESVRFLGPSLLISPCGRCAELPQIGTVVSISRLNQYAVSSTLRASLGKDRAIVLPAGENAPRGVGELGQRRAGG